VSRRSNRPSSSAAAAPEILPESDTPPSSNRRIYERHHFATFALYKRVDEGASDEEEGVARSCDVSLKGAGIVTTRELPAGARLFLEIVGQGGSVSVVGRVMHCTPTGAGQYRVGILVYCIPPTDQQTWKRIMGQ
jgi:hypothetical protein